MAARCDSGRTAEDVGRLVVIVVLVVVVVVVDVSLVNVDAGFLSPLLFAHGHLLIKLATAAIVSPLFAASSLGCGLLWGTRGV